MRVLFYVRSMEWLGVGYLMAYLKKEGHEIELIFDPGINDNTYYKLSFLKCLNRWDKLIAKAISWKPDIVAFSALTNIYPHALSFAKKLRPHLDVPFVFGGIHPTVLPDYVLQNREIDYVLRGESEHAFAELLSCLQNGLEPKAVQNLCYKENNEIIINPIRALICDLDSLPFPSKQKFHEIGAFKSILNIITSRGCPHRCTYCINSFYKNKLYKEISGPVQGVRRRSPQNVIEEIKLRTGQYEIKHICFVDEIFVTDKSWLNEFLSIYKAQVKLPFSFAYHNRFIDDESAKMLAEAGAVFAGGAVETANMDLKRKVLKRTDTEEDILKAAGTLRKHGIKILLYAIFGIPHETEENRWETVRLIEKFNPDIVSSFIMYPYPGTELADNALRDNFLSPENYEKAKCGYSSNHLFSLMQNIDTKNSETIAKLLPLYIKIPRLLKPLVKKMMKMRIPRLSHFIYIATSPYTYSESFVLASWIKDVVRRALKKSPS